MLMLPLLAGLLAGVGAMVAAQPLPRDGLDDDRISRILSHGPWPQPWLPDRSSPVAGRPAAIDFGRRLFFDARMSPSGRISCSSCHRPELAWSDGRPLGIGLKPGTRNTPGLLDVRDRRRLGWTGAGATLWLQSLRPLLDATEMGSSAQHVKSHIESQPELAAAYAELFGRAIAGTDAETASTDAAKALAAYQETIVSGRTAFDDFRNALVASDRSAAASYPPAALRGLAVFIGAGGCRTCHAGPGFTDDSVRDVGLGLRMRVPTLRNVARTAPYMHDGAQATLADAIGAHAEFPGNSGRALTNHEVADLAAFLGTLSQR